MSKRYTAAATDPPSARQELRQVPQRREQSQQLRTAGRERQDGKASATDAVRGAYAG